MAMLALVLSGCQEFRGPAWSPDGLSLAYTAYTFDFDNKSGSFQTDLYLLEPEEEGAQPQLLAKGAAFPFWSIDGPTLYFAGERDSQGFYTTVFRYRGGDRAPQPVLSKLRLTQLQFSSSGARALLCGGEANKGARLGAPGTVELWSLVDGKRTDLAQLGELYSPCLLPNGRSLAYVQKHAGKPLMMVCNLAENLEPRAVFPTPEHPAQGALTFTIHAFPDNSKFLVYAPGGDAVWTVGMPRADESKVERYPLPSGMSSPVMVSLAEDSDSAYLTLAQTNGLRPAYLVYKLDLLTRKFTRLEGEGSEPIGGHALDPRSKRRGTLRMAWNSPAGLALGDPQALAGTALSRARYFPRTAAQYLVASALLVKSNEPAKAVAAALKARDIKPAPLDLASLDRAEFRAYLATKDYVRAAEALERLLLMNPVGAEGLNFLFPAAVGLPRAAGETEATEKEMDDVIRAVPDRFLLPLLKKALSARMQGNQKQALAIYKEALPICPDEARIGAVRFLAAICEMERGERALAGENWEAAARSADFPQADYAALLSAVAYTLDGRAESAAKAAAVLKQPVFEGSPLAREGASLPAHLRGKMYRDSSTGKEILAPDQTVRLWVESERYSIPFASLTPQRIQDRDESFVERRVGVRSVTVSSVRVAGIEQPVFRIARALTPPIFSPNSALIAFAVSGDVFPGPETFCDVFVIDARGGIVMGNPAAKASGRVRSRHIVRALEWSSATELKVSGADVDAFGGETPFTRTLTVPTATPVFTKPAK